MSEICWTAPRRYWENVIWTNETKTEFFGKNMCFYVLCEKGAAYQHENIILTLTYSGGCIMI